MEEKKYTQKKVQRLKRRTTNVNFSLPNTNILILYANKPFKITEDHIKSIKNDLLNPKGLTLGKLNKLFSIQFYMKPNKSFTQKGILVRMGKGKGKIKNTGLYLTPNKICITLIPVSSSVSNTNYIHKLLDKFVSKYSFFSYRNYSI